MHEDSNGFSPRHSPFERILRESMKEKPGNHEVAMQSDQTTQAIFRHMAVSAKDECLGHGKYESSVEETAAGNRVFGGRIRGLYNLFQTMDGNPKAENINVRKRILSHRHHRK